MVSVSEAWEPLGQQMKFRQGQSTNKVSSEVFSRCCTEDVPYLLWTDDPEIEQFIDPKT